MSHNPYSAPSTSVADFDHSAALVRPRAATIGVAIFWAMMIIGLIGAIANVFLSPELKSLPKEFPRGVVLGIAAVFIAVVYAIIFWILNATGKGKNWGRVTLTVLVGLSAVAAVAALATGTQQLTPSSVQDVLYLVQLVCEVAAIVLLFMPASNAWYAAKRAAAA